jgi:serine/threonine protein kinase
MDADPSGVTQALNATLALLAPNATLPRDFNVSTALHWLTILNSSIATNNVTGVTLLLKELNITTPMPTVLKPLAPLANATADAEKAKMAKLAAQKAYLLYLESRFHTLQLFLIAGYGIMCALSVGLVCYLRFNRSVALKGDTGAACKIILPAFEPLLVVVGLATGMYTLFLCLALATGMFDEAISKLWTEVFYSGRQFVFLSVVVFMLQKSVSGPALRRSMLITLALSTYTLPIVWYMVTYGAPEDMYAVLTVSRSFMLLLYTYIFVRPPGRASKRTLREFCFYAYLYYALLYTYNELFRQGKVEPGFNLTYANLLCGSLCPLVIFRVLKADTEHWRGMGNRAVSLQVLFRRKNNLPERVSSKGLHVLIEMHRKYIIDFAYLEIKHKIGTGASAVVFKGILKSKMAVAVKVYTPSDFTEDTVAGFSQEAALCGALHHPNIVKFYGMCVCPPTICLVSELCQGSLEDVMGSMAQRTRTHANRQQLLINVMYMLDAARAVAYIHSFSPAFLHRDIKPANFLVDVDNTVKLTDFGESRSLPRTNIARNRTKGGGIARESSRTTKTSSRDSVVLTSGAGLQQVRGSEFGGVDETTRMTIKGTVDYMAPEIINGKAGQASYGEAADVYSLGITMWDIMNPGREKFPGTIGNHFKIFEAVSQGQRPELDQNMHGSLRLVIDSAWQADPRLRPSAQTIVGILETIQEEIAAVFALEMSEELEDELVLTKQGGKTAIEISTFTGQRAVEYMETNEVVATTSEAVRLGNALLDAGLVHHLKHARPFENATSVYFFDEESINLCQPLNAEYRLAKRAAGERDSDVEDRMTEVTSATRRTKHMRSQRSASTHGEHYYGGGGSSGGPSSDHTLLENGLCACRKLGQRLALPKALSRRGRFRRNKYKAIAEESVLHASLLQEDHHADNGVTPELLLRHSHSDFDEFDSIHVHGSNAHA